jgi:hypothetical protein
MADQQLMPDQQLPPGSLPQGSLPPDRQLPPVSLPPGSLPQGSDQQIMPDQQPLTIEQINVYMDCYTRFFTPDARGFISADQFSRKMTEMLMEVAAVNTKLAPMPGMIADVAKVQQEILSKVAADPQQCGGLNLNFTKFLELMQTSIPITWQVCSAAPRCLQDRTPQQGRPSTYDVDDVFMGDT